MQNRQLIVAIEGLDKAGKQTQSRLLKKALSKRGLTSKLFHFPNYRTLIGDTISRHLASKRRRSVVPAPQVLHCLQAANKWDELGKIKDACQKYNVVIMDRYYASNRAYGAARGLDPAWLANLEDGLPTADITILLDIPAAVSFQRRLGNRDAFERDAKLLTGVRDAYCRMAKKEGWMVIPADRPRDEVHHSILEHLMPAVGDATHAAGKKATTGTAVAAAATAAGAARGGGKRKGTAASGRAQNPQGG